MSERTANRVVSFSKPFKLGGVNESMPAGNYIVETLEEQIDGLSFVAYRRISTTITLSAGSRSLNSRQVIEIDPRDLEQALARDSAAEQGQAQPV